MYKKNNIYLKYFIVAHALDRLYYFFILGLYTATLIQELRKL